MKYSDIMDDEALANVLKGLDDSVSVPENAAGQWREGVKKRMRFDKRLNSIRWAGEITAVLLLVLCVFAAPFGSVFGINSGVEQEQERHVKYAYSDIKLMVSGLSFIESDSSDTGAMKEITESEEAGIDSVSEDAGVDDTVFTIRDISDTSMFSIDGDNLVMTAKVFYYTKNVDDSVKAFKNIAASYDTISEDEISEQKGNNNTVSGKLRVRKDEAEEFLDAVKAAFSKAEITVESHDFESSYIDASSRIYDLEDIIASLKTRIDLAEQNEIESLREQLSKARNELESIKAEADEYLLDKEYVTVSYSFTSVRTQALFGFTGSSAFGAGIMIAVILLTVVITLHVSSTYRKRKLFA